PPAEFFFLLFYTLHNGEVVLENVISHIKPISAYRSKRTFLSHLPFALPPFFRISFALAYD
ncbi:hypothetical protein, partial [Klebsiella pneumoniae]|uniref:hypothetical protein n=1 Tax=Klebsiella pneumoniae TaxID=573 RepID=UPI001CB6F64C